MNIKTGYYYLFYKFHKFGEASPSIFPSDFIAALAITLLEIWFLGSLKIYYKFFNRSDTITFISFQTLAPLTAILLINYLAFINNDKWKTYARKFDKFPKNKDVIGTWIVIGIVAFIIGNLGFSLYLIGKINGKY